MLKLAVIGDPIAHSLSPAVHTAALDCIGAAHHYDKIQVKKGELEAFLERVRLDGIDGFNLTMPHKVDILPYLEAMDEAAERFQSVNTVRVKDGKLYGYNTDAGGYTEALCGAGYRFADSRVVILGAGGVVRTLALEAAWQGAKEIRILNRTRARAEEVCAMVRAKTKTPVTAGLMTEEALCESCESCDILINGTPLGMHGVAEDFTDLTFLERLPRSALVSDLIYNPEQTQLLVHAKAQGLATLNGMGMLIYQALLADRIYTETSFAMQPVYEHVAAAMRAVLK